MHRRTFAAGLGALLTGAGVADVARADAADTLQQGAQRSLRLRLADGRFQTVNGFGISDGQQSFGLDWTQHIPTFLEDRVDLSGAGGGIGGLFRTPFPVRWGRAVPIGDVELIGARLISRVHNAARYGGSRVTVGVGAYSWDLPSQLTAEPAIAGRGQSIGAIRLGDDGRLLVRLAAQPVL